ncbi:MAG: alanine racemase [Phycisphaeraceae bacterium]|nr:alanine racemase [Phycisphaeraceae bacterium]
MSSLHASWLEIDLSRLDANLSSWRDFLAERDSSPCPVDEAADPADPVESVAPPADPPAPATKICAVLKADGYGLGAVSLAHRLSGRGVDMIAVYSPEQARDIAASGLNCPVLLLMPVRDLARRDVLYRLAAAKRLHLTAHDPEHIEELSRLARKLGLILPIQLYVDTGMSRAGLRPEAIPAAVARVLDARNLCLTGIYTHFSSPRDNWERTCGQNDLFGRVLASLAPGQCDPSLLLHAAGTYAALRDRAFHHGMVRLGLGLFGYGPEMLDGGPRLDPAPTLLPIVRWISQLVHIQRYPAGATVGYDASFTLQRDSVLGVVPVGYADGYPLSLSNRGMVEINREDQQLEPALAPVLGKVNMDQTVIDLTDIPDVAIDQKVELISNRPDSPASLARLAEAAKSNCYELLCRLSTRLARVYVRTELAQPVPTRLKQFDPTTRRVSASF